MTEEQRASPLILTQTITRHLQRSRFSGKYADFKIIIGNKVFPTHKFILGNKSMYFRNLLQAGENQTPLDSYEYKDHSAEAIGVCLEYIYTDKLDIESYNAASVIKVGHLWKLQFVVTKCERILKDHLTVINCLKTRVLSTNLGLAELGEAANKVILGNVDGVVKFNDLVLLSLIDMTLIKNTAMERASVRIKDLWTLFEAWNRRKETTEGHDTCKSFQTFPFAQFTVTGFKEYVWTSKHLAKCETCTEMAARALLDNVDVIRRSDDVVFIKKLAKLYKFYLLNEMAHQYIVKNHVKIFTSPDVVGLDGEDMMRCIDDIAEMCTPGEFTAIVKWMENEPSRQDIFPEMFKCVEDPTCASKSTFLSSFCGFFGLSEPTAKEVLSVNNTEQYWWPKHCIFLKKMARKYSCYVTEKFVDQCIIGGFESVSRDEGFLELTESDLKTYLSSRSTYSSDKSEIWEALMRWVRHHETRKQSFQGLFDSMKLDEFDTGFLKSKIMSNALVMESQACLFAIVREMMDRLESLEKNQQTAIDMALASTNNKH